VHKENKNNFIQQQLSRVSLRRAFTRVTRALSWMSTEGQIQKALGFHQKYLNLCSENEHRSFGSGTTWEWVIDGWPILFKCVNTCGSSDRTPCEFEWNWLHTSTKTLQNTTKQQKIKQNSANKRLCCIWAQIFKHVLYASDLHFSHCLGSRQCKEASAQEQKVQLLYYFTIVCRGKNFIQMNLSIHVFSDVYLELNFADHK